jgi:hypothetical protein
MSLKFENCRRFKILVLLLDSGKKQKLFLLFHLLQTVFETGVVSRIILKLNFKSSCSFGFKWIT